MGGRRRIGRRCGRGVCVVGVFGFRGWDSEFWGGGHIRWIYWLAFGGIGGLLHIYEL